MEENGTLRCCQYQRTRTETLTASWAIKIATGSSGHCRRYSIGQKGHAHRFCCHLEAMVDSECAHQDRSDQPHSGVCGGNTESCGGSGARNNVTTQTETAVQRRSSWKGRCRDDNFFGCQPAAVVLKLNLEQCACWTDIRSHIAGLN